MDDPSITFAAKSQYTETIYNAVYHGWSADETYTAKSATLKSKKCGLNCSQKVCTGFGTRAKHGHMMQHMRRVLGMIKASLITKGAPPAPKPMEERPRAGNITVGDRTAEGHQMTVARTARWGAMCREAMLDPERYSRWVLVPPQNDQLKDRKIEMRIAMEREVEDAETGETRTEEFVHCFEGTVTAVRENEAGAKRVVLGVKSKWAVATVAWDVEFHEFGDVTHHALDPGLYGNETKNGGWNILNDAYLAAADCDDRDLPELAQRLKGSLERRPGS